MNYKIYNLSKNLKDSLCNICLHVAVIANREKDKKEIINRYITKVEYGLHIDWEGRKEWDNE
jgi:hypothetical protein